MAPGKNMVWQLVGETQLCVHGTKDPSPPEWTRYCDEIRAHGSEIRGIVVHSAGGSLTSAQRAEVRDAWGGHKTPRMSIMTSSMVVRGVVAALNWFLDNRLRAFNVHDFEGAFGYLEVPKAQAADLIRGISELRVSLGLPPIADR